jgi:hypothetical protein
MMPTIAAYARLAFRHQSPEARQEAIEECLANALVAYVRLVQLDKVSLAYPTVLARYAVAQVNDGRKVGGHLNIHDVSSAYCQRQKQIIMERLDHFDEEENQWQEAVVQDTRTAPVPDIVAFRCDFPEWLNRLSSRNRRIALKLATSETTSRVARMFKVSAARVSQLRKEFKLAWEGFHGEARPLEAASVSA